MFRVIQAAATAAALLAGSAQATLFDFNYAYSFTGPTGLVTGNLSGRIDGVLQSDNNNVLVNALVGPVSIDGQPVATLLYTNAFTAHFANQQSFAFVTLDGLQMNFIACETSACNGSIFAVRKLLTDPVPGGTLIGGIGSLNTDEAYDARGWSMRAVTGGVPEPASWAMLIAGFGLVGAVARRRNAIAA
jgi:PEP-CTERM motif